MLKQRDMRVFDYCHRSAKLHIFPSPLIFLSRIRDYRTGLIPNIKSYTVRVGFGVQVSPRQGCNHSSKAGGNLGVKGTEVRHRRRREGDAEGIKEAGNGEGIPSTVD